MIIVEDEWRECSKGTVAHVSAPRCGLYSTVNVNRAVIFKHEAILALNSVANETERHIVTLRRGLAAARLQVSRRKRREWL